MRLIFCSLPRTDGGFLGLARGFRSGGFKLLEHRARGGAHRCRRVIPRLSGDLLRVILRELRSSGAVSCDMVCKIDVGRHGLARVQEGLNLIGRANVALYRELPVTPSTSTEAQVAKAKNRLDVISNQAQPAIVIAIGFVLDFNQAQSST